MGKLVLYGSDPCPPVRACKLTLHALGLEYEFKLMNVLARENKSKEFISKNPQHTVPMLEDEGKCIWDSHAIMAYLVRKYGKNDELYPKDFYKRAVVDQRLHFESGVICQGCLRNISYPLFYLNESEVPRLKIDAIYEAYDFLEAFLGTESYMCGATVTIADFSIVSTVSSFQALAPIASSRNPRLDAWLERMKQLPNYHENNGYGAQLISDIIISKITKIV